jgi:hypothetical protein
VAATADGAALTEAHRQAQLALRAQAVRDLLVVWPMLDPRALDGTFPAYSRTAEALIAAYRARSADLASAYYRAFREAEGVPPAPDLVVDRAPDLPRAQTTTSLLVTGPVAVKTAVRKGSTTEKAVDLALAQTIGAVTRHVLGGGRETLGRTTRRDPARPRWARVTDADPCSFCAMLASRGAVYLTAESAGAHDWHDKCGCTAEPAFGEDYQLPGRSAEFAALWEDTFEKTVEAGGSFSQATARNAFRRAYDAQRASS